MDTQTSGDTNKGGILTNALYDTLESNDNISVSQLKTKIYEKIFGNQKPTFSTSLEFDINSKYSIDGRSMFKDLYISNEHNFNYSYGHNMPNQNYIHVLT